ncbi:hypothetical protein BO82DRAFT_3528 [Aspergillus uvarum CBS 121591]|uniref:Uncharacterized protein n=1 Tax=Aspergillus uvarum CBS 121591 TaxID=1448315 RepID=A0A319CRQ1_9EURO|nr:hypothetical protein BO82DRAFT_3528 [Aspergillus uvarum CBS 121591]PYH87129.1 hypothetical protein BO82DRAFT_3528 [Aspergillus uvarum CBS 121591]
MVAYGWMYGWMEYGRMVIDSGWVAGGMVFGCDSRLLERYLMGFERGGRTGVSVVIVLLFVIRGKKDVVLAGLRLLLGEVLVLDFGELDHCDVWGV